MSVDLKPVALCVAYMSNEARGIFCKASEKLQYFDMAICLRMESFRVMIERHYRMVLVGRSTRRREENNNKQLR